jgi:hypothetical protein
VKRVILETPYRGDIDVNISFARACLRDCLLRGESPIASHLLYTQEGVLDDNDADQRRLGIKAGLAWVHVADATVVYTDLGITEGMQQGIDFALDAGREVIMRTLKS